MFDKKEYMKIYNKQYYKNNCKKEIDRHIQWQKDNSKKVNKNNRQWQKNNPGKIKKWRKNNHEKIKENHRQYMNMKRKTDLRFNLNHKISREMYKSLKGNKAGRSWESLVGYTLENLIKRLKKTMPKSYCWNDYLNGNLHIDHIIPISVFNFDKSEHIEFKKCWSLRNLRLLPAKENLCKHNKITRPFQPALKI